MMALSKFESMKQLLGCMLCFILAVTAIGQNFTTQVRTLDTCPVFVLPNGVDNPIPISLSEAESMNLAALHDKGAIVGSIEEDTLISVAIQIGDSLIVLLSKTSIEKDYLKNAISINLVGENMGFHVFEFTIALVTNGVLMEAVSDGAFFSPEQMAIIEMSTPGSEIYIENIRVKNFSGSVQIAPTVVILVD